MNTRPGFIKIILLIVILLIALGYFGINIRSILESPVVRDNLHWLGEFLAHLWSAYLRTPVLWLWDNVFWPVLQLLLKLLRTNAA